ncbi:TetR/AcrR family transcriptional regulator [Nocardiopsis sp. HNM0947]|uniref:TetR/AcrR family transcriptional regulator n=1 Tax=Nocardiopsis coralli TaxID=2772213 RepID=A0ABR9P2A9_9ACTN|nr:TetR/AcrR family transcriptional regulator [Nocardiopsis coralli]MBE2997942.1 TetR/AcrR family transcriptional regulator [Nocardiopsis coralli]
MRERRLGERPLTTRGRRTRNALVEAAREVFEEKGFEETRVAEVAARARLAHGTFYTYFDSKDDVLHEVAKGLTAEMFEASRSGEPADAGPVDRIRASTERFLRVYRDNARMMHVIEQVSPRNPRFAHVYLEIRGLFVDRIASGIRRLQKEGAADPALDADTAASMLGGMVEHFARVWFLHGQEHDADNALETATVLWARGIGLELTPADGDTASPRTSRGPSAAGAV